MRITNSIVHKNNLKNQVAQEYAPLPLWGSLLIALMGGSVFALALAPYKIWAIALLSPLLLYALLLPKIRSKHAFFVGWSYGFGLWFVGAFWLYHSIHEYGAVPSWLALIMIGLMALVMGLFHAVMAWIFVRFLGKQPLAFAAVWVVQEWLKTWLFTGFPWLFVGYAFTEQYWISSIAPVLGVFGVSFLAVLLGASVIDALRGKVGFLIIATLTLMISAMLWLVEPKWTTSTNKTLSVSLVQGNIPQDLKWLSEYRNQTLEIYAQLSQAEWGRDVVIWPEAAIPMLSYEALPFISEVANLASSHKSAWVTGIPFVDLENHHPNETYPPLYNAVLAVGHNTTQGLYKKQNLVPFGEYIPMKGLFDILPDLANSQDMYSHTKGEKNQQLLMVQGRAMASAICYEVAYPSTTRHNAKNSEFLLTISNDAWFGTSAGPHQHLQMVQMRSLETGRWFVRATNTGITALIDDKGRIVGRAPQFERTVLRGDVMMMSGETPYMRFGDSVILMLCVCLVGLSAWARRQARWHDSEYSRGVAY